MLGWRREGECIGVNMGCVCVCGGGGGNGIFKTQLTWHPPDGQVIFCKELCVGGRAKTGRRE